MAIMLFSSPVELSTGPLGVSLAKRLPGWRWQCGESFGTADEKLPLDRKQLVMGRSGDEILFCTIEALQFQPLSDDGLPPHTMHLKIGTPTTEDPMLALTLTLLIAAALLEGRGNGAWLDIAENGHWLAGSEMDMAMGYIGSRADIGGLARLGRPAGSDWGGAAMPVPAPATAAEPVPPLPVPAPEPEPAHETVYATQPTEFFRRATAGGFGRKGL